MCSDVTRENIVTYVPCFLCIQPARTCYVSIEPAPFLPLFFTASVSSAESVSSFKLTMPNRDLSLDVLDHSLHRTVHSILAHTSLLMSGGAIPANKYKSSTYVGLRHPVIAQHDLFISGSNMSTYVDLAHTGSAYSDIE